MELHQTEVCDQCPNYSLVEDDVDIDIVIEPGMRHGNMIKARFQTFYTFQKIKKLFLKTKKVPWSR